MSRFISLVQRFKIFDSVVSFQSSSTRRIINSSCLQVDLPNKEIHLSTNIRFVTTNGNFQDKELESLSSVSPPRLLDDWIPIYRFKHIIVARAIQKLKIYQTGFTCLVILPWSILSTYLGQCSINLAYAAIGASVLACTMLLVMGTMSSRVIGFLYVHKKNSNQLRVARLTFSGSRIDTIVPLNFFVPLTDTSENLGDAYVVLQITERKKESSLTISQEILNTFVQNDRYYLSLRYGIVVEPDVFMSIFGDISNFLRK